MSLKPPSKKTVNIDQWMLRAAIIILIGLMIADFILNVTGHYR